jgi:hypothetical protein
MRDLWPFMWFFYIGYGLDPSHYGYSKHSYTATDFVTFLNTVVPSVGTQGHTDSVYFKQCF